MQQDGTRPAGHSRGWQELSTAIQTSKPRQRHAREPGKVKMRTTEGFKNVTDKFLKMLILFNPRTRRLRRGEARSPPAG